MKIKELAAKLKANEAALIITEENRFYFTGFNSSNGYLFVTKNGGTFITDSRYIEAAKETVKDCRVLLEASVSKQLNELIKEENIKKLLLENTRVSVYDASRYKGYFKGVEVPMGNELDTYISELRMIKTPEEKETLIKAQRIAESAFKKVLPLIKPGVAERDIAIEFDYLLRKGGAKEVSFETIVVSGVNSSKPHGVPSEKLIENGDFVTMDFGALYKGYHSDTTRTVAVGKVSDEMKKVYDTVLKAQLAGVEAIKAGIKGSELDAVCRDIIKDAGYGHAFGHATGHGVGVEIHEEPYASPSYDKVLRAGNTVTVEPGIYLEGKFGVRIEDTLYVTDNGSENFVTLDKELIVL